MLRSAGRVPQRGRKKQPRLQSDREAACGEISGGQKKTPVQDENVAQT